MFSEIGDFLFSFSISFVLGQVNRRSVERSPGGLYPVSFVIL